MTAVIAALTWSDLATREPRLAALLAEAQTVRRTAGPDFDGLATFCGYDDPSAGFKARLSVLVGMHRPDRDPVLASTQAYTVVYTTILDVLEGDEMNAPTMIAVCAAAP